MHRRDAQVACHVVLRHARLEIGVRFAEAPVALVGALREHLMLAQGLLQIQPLGHAPGGTLEVRPPLRQVFEPRPRHLQHFGGRYSR